MSLSAAFVSLALHYNTMFALLAIVIENLESENESTEVQVATLDMSREEFNNSPPPGRPSIIDLAESLQNTEMKSPPSNNFNLNERLLCYTFSKYYNYTYAVFNVYMYPGNY